MANRNIQMKKKNDTGGWDNLYPVTLSTNVFSATGKSMDEVYQDIYQLGTTVVTRSDGLINNIETPTKNITFERNSDGTVTAVYEEYSDGIIKTLITRGSKGEIQIIEREML